VMKIVKSGTIKLIGLLLLGVTLSVHGFSDRQRADIEERIQPAGAVCLQGDSSCGVTISAAGGSAKSADDIYNTNCMACHATGAAGAPKMGDVAAWTGRMDKGIDQIYANAINGINAMPAKGLCMSCSDDDVKSVVDYILDNSK